MIRRMVLANRARPWKWPLVLQVAGALGVCFAVGFLAGGAWALLAAALEALVAGTLAEASTPAAPRRAGGS